MEGDENLQEELASFRQEWHEELYVDNEDEGVGKRKDTGSISSLHNQKDIEYEAYQLFTKGSNLEKEGNVYAAVYYYREAVKLVPDIEFKLAEYDAKNELVDNVEKEGDVDDDSAEEVFADESSAQLRDVTQQMDLLQLSGLCAPEFPQEMTHVSALPTELLLLIFRWVLTKDLDVKSLIRLSNVCKWFYACAKDDEIWKLVCIRIWGIKSSSVHLYNNCWKTMYLQKPRLCYDGVYISENMYVRVGEQSVDSVYKPFHVVEYFKYLRFFTNGSCLVYTSTDNPQTVVQMLHSPPYRDQNIYQGYWRLTGENLVNVFFTRITKPSNLEIQRKKRIQRDHKPDIREHNFYLKLRLSNTKKKRNNKLVWDTYTCQIKHFPSGKISNNDIGIESFRPFFFSAVKSYTSVSLSCL